MFKNAGLAHKKVFDRLIDELGEDVVLRFPPDKTVSTSPVNKAFGEVGDDSTVDESKNVTVTAAVSGPDTMGNIRFYDQRASIDMVGFLYQSDLVIRVKLTSDILLDENKEFGRTQFDMVRDVLVRGQAFTVKGVMRTGFPPLGPYGLYVGLVLSGD